MNKKVVSVDNAKMYEETKKKRRRRVKRALVVQITGLFLFIGILVMGGLYATSIYARINVVEFEGLNNVSKRELIKLMNVDYRDIIAGVDFTRLNEKILEHPLIETAKIEPSLNGIKVSVKEKDIIGCFVSSERNFPVTTTGDVVVYDKYKTAPCYGVMFYELITNQGNESLKLFTTSLAKMEDSFIRRIESVKQEANYNDYDRYSIQMRDGITIKVNAYTMVDKLVYYDQIIERIRSTYGNVTGTLHLDVGDRFEADVDLIKIEDEESEE